MTIDSQLNSNDREVGSHFCRLLRSEDTSSAYRLLAEHAGKLRGFLRSRFGAALGGERDVEDLVVVAIEKALSNADRFQPDHEPGGLECWLFRLGLREAQDEVRRRRESGLAPAGLSAGLSAGEREQLESAVRSAAAALDEPGRTILISDLTCAGRAPLKELSARLQLEPRVVVEHRSLARRVLEPRLEEVAGLDPGDSGWSRICAMLGYEPDMLPFAPEESELEHRRSETAAALPSVRTMHPRFPRPRAVSGPRSSAEHVAVESPGGKAGKPRRGRWSGSEIERFKELYGLRDEGVIARELNRSLASIRKMAKSVYKDTPRTDPWTHDDVQELKKYLGATDIRTIARVLHRTPADVQAHIAELARIKRRGPWQQSEVGDFKRLYGTRTDEDLALVFGRDLGDIRDKASKLCVAKDKSFLRKRSGGQRASRMPRWREGELKALGEMYSTHSNLSIAKALSRSVKSIVSKAHSMGLRKDPQRLREMGRENVSFRYGKGSTQ